MVTRIRKSSSNRVEDTRTPQQRANVSNYPSTPIIHKRKARVANVPPSVVGYTPRSRTSVANVPPSTVGYTPRRGSRGLPPARGTPGPSRRSKPPLTPTQRRNKRANPGMYPT